MLIAATLGTQRATTTLRCQLTRTGSSGASHRNQLAAPRTVARDITGIPRGVHGEIPQKLCTRWRLGSSAATSVETNEEAEAPAEFCVFMEVGSHSRPQLHSRLMQHPAGLLVIITGRYSSVM